MISLKEYNVGDQVYCPRPTVVFTTLIDLNMAFAEFISKNIVYLFFYPNCLFLIIFGLFSSLATKPWPPRAYSTVANGENQVPWK